MTSSAQRRVAAALVILGGAGLASALRPAPVATALPALTRHQGTSVAEMDAALTVTSARLAADPADVPAAIRAAEVLLRKARAERSALPAIEAERILRALLDREPNEYSALKLLGGVYLSLHKFRDALATAERGIAIRPKDAWNYGVLGDAHLELGDRTRAFAAFDTMVSLRPDAASYSRVSYALELQGDLQGALKVMSMATDATSADDAEGLAWQHVQLGGLHARIGDVEAARRAFARALQAWPAYPDAVDGLARLDAAASGPRQPTPRPL